MSRRAGQAAAARDQAFIDRYGPWAVVTGASEGIGRAIAIELAGRGLNLLLVARRGELLRELCVDLVRQHGIECMSAAVDLSTVDGCAAVRARAGSLDVGLLVAAAGFGSSGAFVAGSLDVERDMLAVNCASVLELVGHFGPQLVERGRGGVVLVSSVLAFQGVPGSAHYAATKAWVQTLAEGLQAEWRPLGVDVVSSAPGPVDTGFAARADLKMGAMLAPDVVARQTLDALGRRGTVRPGWLSKLLGYSLATLPRGARTAVLAQVMRGMTAHQREARAAGSPTA